MITNEERWNQCAFFPIYTRIRGILCFSAQIFGSENNKIFFIDRFSLYRYFFARKKMKENSDETQKNKL